VFPLPPPINEQPPEEVLHLPPTTEDAIPDETLLRPPPINEQALVAQFI
jgi:hypothetical protein